MLVEVDFPRRSQLPAKIRDQNEELRQEFGVVAFPSLFLSDSEGRPFVQIRNQPGIDAAQLASQMRSFAEIAGKRVALIEEASSLEGLKRAEKLDEALKTLSDEMVDRFYSDLRDEIIALDEKDTLKRKKDGEGVRDYYEIEKVVQELAQQGKDDAIAGAVDKFIKDRNLKSENKQRALMLKLGIYGVDQLEEAAQLLEKIVKIQSKSETARTAQEIRSRLLQYSSER